MANLKPPKKPGSLLGRRDVREALGVSKARVQVLEERLPAPQAMPDGRPVWRKSDIDRFIAKHQGGRRRA